MQFAPLPTAPQNLHRWGRSVGRGRCGRELGSTPGLLEEEIEMERPRAAPPPRARRDTRARCQKLSCGYSFQYLFSSPLPSPGEKNTNSAPRSPGPPLKDTLFFTASGRSNPSNFSLCGVHSCQKHQIYYFSRVHDHRSEVCVGSVSGRSYGRAHSATTPS